MSYADACSLWPRRVVEAALAEPDPEPTSLELVAELRARSDPETGGVTTLAEWAEALPWARFCAVVRVVTGETRLGLLEGPPS